jgi:hypothetical protein
MGKNVIYFHDVTEILLVSFSLVIWDESTGFRVIVSANLVFAFLDNLKTTTTRRNPSPIRGGDSIVTLILLMSAYQTRIGRRQQLQHENDTGSLCAHEMYA